MIHFFLKFFYTFAQPNAVKLKGPFSLNPSAALFRTDFCREFGTSALYFQTVMGLGSGLGLGSLYFKFHNIHFHKMLNKNTATSNIKQSL